MTHHKKVIELPSPKTWTFWDYMPPGGEASDTPIEAWRKTLPDEAEKMFNNILKFNRTAPDPRQWIGRGRHFFLEGKSRDERIWELVFHDSDDVQYRILGIFWPRHARKQATLLIGCRHKQNVPRPRIFL